MSRGLLCGNGIHKRYGGTTALAGVDFTVSAGEVTTLFGENGAGKSTLMKILSGVEQPSDGTLLLDGEPIVFESASHAAENGVVIIHQELSLCPNLSVCDNIFMGREMLGRGGFVDYESEQAAVRDLMARLREQIDPTTLVGDLRLGQQQIVEIARALSMDARVLIMDEPTSALSANEVLVLFDVIRELTAAGVAIVYISHHLEEALEISDRVVVLKDGNIAGRAMAKDIDLKWIVETMVGGQLDLDSVHADDPSDDVRLMIDRLTVVDPHNAKRVAVDELSLSVNAGEIVCIYGVMGSGRTELLEAVAGKGTILSGDVSVDGKSLTKLSIRDRIRSGLALVPEDRQRDGLVQTMSIRENISLANIADYVVKGLLSHRAECDAADRAIADLGVKTKEPSLLIDSLSGGNQQKVVIGKILQTRPKVILLDEPSRGIDVRAKGEVFRLLASLARDGLSVVYATSEMVEALSVAHRTIVMSRGRIAGEFITASASKDQLMTVSGEMVTTVEGHK